MIHALTPTVDVAEECEPGECDRYRRDGVLTILSNDCADAVRGIGRGLPEIKVLRGNRPGLVRVGESE